MSDSARPTNLELEVNDFGPIIAGKIDLRPLTVFVGPSNTGKSYLAILVYALHKHFSHKADRALYNMTWGAEEITSDSFTLSQPIIDELTRWAKHTVANLQDKSPVQNVVLTEQLVNVIPAEALDIQGADLRNEISRCFGANDPGALVRQGNSDEARIVFGKSLGHESAHPRHEHFLRKHRQSESKTILGRTPMSVDLERGHFNRMRAIADALSTGSQVREGRDTAMARLLFFAASLARTSITAPLHFPAYYLPAGRTGIMHAHSLVVSSLIRNASRGRLREEAQAPMFTGVLTDFLEQLIKFATPPPRQRESTPVQDFGAKIEDDILGGSVRVEKSEPINYPSFGYRPKGWGHSLSLSNASSMVTELAPIVLYLQRVVQRGDVLIIEEPESHLHPGMQVEVTELLTALVHSGVRVIITTHSEWVLEAIGNIVRRSALPEAEHNGGVTLRPDQVGAWLFKPKRRPKGSVVEEVLLDEETGLYQTDYDAVSEALYNENVSIFNRIQEKKAK